MAERNQKGDPVYLNQLITVGDLDRFKTELLEEIRRIVQGSPKNVAKKWLKTSDVKKLLDISSAKLHILRVNRELPFTKIGGIIYYDQQDISNMFEKGKIQLKESRS